MCGSICLSPGLEFSIDANTNASPDRKGPHSLTYGKVQGVGVRVKVRLFDTCGSEGIFFLGVIQKPNCHKNCQYFRTVVKLLGLTRSPLDVGRLMCRGQLVLALLPRPSCKSLLLSRA